MAYNYSYTSSGVTFANLAVACGGGSKAPTPPNCAPQIPGSQVFCKDCTQTTSCGPSGTGAWAVLQGAGTWGCNVNNVAQAGVSGVLTNLTAGPGSISIQGNTGNGTDKLTGIANINGTVYANSFAGADIGAKINNAITTLGAQGGVVKVPAGFYSFSTTVQCPLSSDAPIIIQGDGKAPDDNSDPSPGEGTVLSYTGSTDAVNQVITNTSFQSYSGCQLRDLTLDGNNGATDVGLHVGGTAYTRTNNVSIRSFGKAGIELENAASMFTERYDISGSTQLIGNAVNIKYVCDASCNQSFEHGNIDIWETVVTTGVGIQVNNNSIIQNGDVRINGNLAGTTSATELALTGTAFFAPTTYTTNEECDAGTSCVRFNIGAGTTFESTIHYGIGGGPFINSISGTFYGDSATFPQGISGHLGLAAQSIAPTVTACGTGSPSISANSRDSWGSVTTGTGSPTNCTINFGNAPNAWHENPICLCQVTSVPSDGCSVSTTGTAGIIMSFEAGTTSAVVNWVCATGNP